MVKITSKKGKVNIKISGEVSEVLADSVIAVRGIYDAVKDKYGAHFATLFKESVQTLIAGNASGEPEKEGSDLDSRIERCIDILLDGIGMD